MINFEVSAGYVLIRIALSDPGYIGGSQYQSDTSSKGMPSIALKTQ